MVVHGRGYEGGRLDLDALAIAFVAVRWPLCRRTTRVARQLNDRCLCRSDAGIPELSGWRDGGG